MTQTYRGDEMAKIVKLVEIIPAHPASLKEDYLELEELALMHKQAQEFEKWLNQKIDAMYVRIAPEFRNIEFENRRWIK
jgi:peptidyl-prolyl cis-trans isomerase SurA